MTNLIIHGCCGKMGQVVAQIAASDDKVNVVAGIDKDAVPALCAFPVFSNLYDCEIAADAIIDFSNAAAVDALLSYAESRNVPLVLCTTGLSDTTKTKIKSVSYRIPVLQSANMSLGINLFYKILGGISKQMFDAGYDVEIVEKHHNQKVDAPSGTALALADSLNAALPLSERKEFCFDRTAQRKKRDKSEIGFAVVRGGTITGEHEVIFAGEDEMISFSHSIYSKRVFAKGAVEAAKFLKGKPAGLYDMGDVLN